MHQPLEEDQQLNDLESLSQRLRALEILLAPPIRQQPQQHLNQQQSPRAERATGPEGQTGEQTEDIVSTSNVPAQSPTSPSNRRDHHNHHSHKHGSNKDPQHTPGSLSRRVQKIETAFWAAAKERKPSFEEFLNKLNGSSKLVDSPYSSHSDRDLLTLQAKTELVLAAQEELEKLAQDSKEIQNLQRCAELGGLKNVASEYPTLAKLETVHIEQSQACNKVSDKMNKLTDDYNGLINTLSEVFISWDALLTVAEQKVAEVERSRQ
ncbi:Dynactin subunit 3 [Podila epigama]|nr:Dynactin subunit 3 [Podila epigama]